MTTLGQQQVLSRQMNVCGAFHQTRRRSSTVTIPAASPDSRVGRLLSWEFEKSMVLACVKNVQKERKVKNLRLNRQPMGAGHSQATNGTNLVASGTISKVTDCE